MPLYQGLGEDGFFLASEIHPFWLFVSTLLRRARLAVVLQLLPGVARHRERANSLVVDTRIARWFPLEIFHLFGFRKLRWQGPVLIVSRRPYDLTPPSRRCGRPAAAIPPPLRASRRGRPAAAPVSMPERRR
jgi:hypothetical protein